jgi:hypothetical protein
MVPLFVVQDHPMLALLASFFRSCRRQERADARKNDEISCYSLDSSKQKTARKKETTNSKYWE